MTNEDAPIELSLMEGLTIPDNTDGRYYGPRTPEHRELASVSIEIDGETNREGVYEQWIWFMFGTDNEPWIRFTIEEAEAVYARLGSILNK